MIPHHHVMSVWAFIQVQMNTDGDVLTYLATIASPNDCCTSLLLLCVVQYFLGVLECKYMFLQCLSSIQVSLTAGLKLAPCRYVAPAGGEGRLVGCCPRLRGPDLGEDSSPVPSLPFTIERKSGRKKEEEITNKALNMLPFHPFLHPCFSPFISSFLSLPLPSSLIDFLCLSGHLFIPFYYRIRHPGSASSSRQTDVSVSACHQGNKY